MTDCTGTGGLPAEWSERSRRGTCATCGRRRVALKKDGTLFAHTPPSVEATP